MYKKIKEKYDIVIAHDVHALIASDKVKKLFIFDASEVPYDGPQNPDNLYKNSLLLRNLRKYEIKKENLIIRKVDLLVTVSDGLKKYLENKFSKKSDITKKL